MQKMRRAYVAPEAKVYNICSEERVANACGGSSFTYQEWGCTEVLVGGAGDEACNSGTGNFSS